MTMNYNMIVLYANNFQNYFRNILFYPLSYSSYIFLQITNSLSEWAANNTDVL